MAITYNGDGSLTYGTSSINVYPPNCVVGDLLLLFAESENQPIIMPSGWTFLCELGTGTAGTDTSTLLSVFYKFATSSDVSGSAVTISDSGDHTSGLMIGFNGVNSTTPFDVTPSMVIATGASMSFPSVTTLTDGAMIINVTSLNQDSAGSTSLSSWVNSGLVSITEAFDMRSASGGGGGFGFAYGIKSTAGLVPATTVSVATTENAQSHSLATIALRSADAVVNNNDRSGSVTSSNGEQYTKSGKKSGKGASTSTSGFNQTIVTKKVGKTTLVDHIGEQYTTTYNKSTLVIRTGTASGSVGIQTSIVAKKLTRSPPLSDVVGFQSTNVFKKKGKNVISSSVGEQSTKTVKKSVTKILVSNLGETTTKSGKKSAKKAIGDSLGFNVFISSTVGIPQPTYFGSALDSIGINTLLGGKKQGKDRIISTIGLNHIVTTNKTAKGYTMESAGEVSLIKTLKTSWFNVVDSIGEKFILSYSLRKPVILERFILYKNIQHNILPSGICKSEYISKSKPKSFIKTVRR